MNRRYMLKRLRAGESPLVLVREKWVGIRDGTGKDKGADNCALCEIQPERDITCSKCIVVKNGGIRCNGERSLYAGYVHAEGKGEKHKAADKIIEFIDKLIQKEEKKN